VWTVGVLATAVWMVGVLATAVWMVVALVAVVWTVLVTEARALVEEANLGLVEVLVHQTPGPLHHLPQQEFPFLHSWAS